MTRAMPTHGIHNGTHSQDRCSMSIIILTLIPLLLLLAHGVAAAESITPTIPSHTDDTALHRAHRAYALAHRKSCGQLALQLGVPQVALLFLTTTELFLNSAWHAWLSAVNGKLPALAVASSCAPSSNTSTPKLPDAFREQHAMAQLGPFHTNQLLLDELATSCRALSNDPTTPAIFRQQLFNIYAHAPPDFPEYAADSLLFGRRITQRVPSVRISHTLVTVERFLLREALQWSLNSRFVFLSESHLPLYPAAMIYMQLVHEPRARIDACPPLANRDEDSISFWRWKPELSPKELWRKTSHWITMTRAVASVVVHERQVDAAFEQHCLNHCSNIEHYIPTMLAVHNLVHLTSCARGSTYVDWTVKNSEGRPRTFFTHEVNQGMLQYARSFECGGDLWAHVEHAQRGLVDVDLLGAPVCDAAVGAPAYTAMDVGCALFVRKIHKNASEVATTLVKGMGEEGVYRVEAIDPPRGGAGAQENKEEHKDAPTDSHDEQQQQQKTATPSAEDVAAAAAAAAVAAAADDSQIPREQQQEQKGQHNQQQRQPTDTEQQQSASTSP